MLRVRLLALLSLPLSALPASALVTRDITISLADAFGHYHYRETLHSEGERLSYSLPASVDADSVIFSTGEQGRWQATRTRHPIFSGEHGGVLYTAQWTGELSQTASGELALTLRISPLGRQNNLLTLSWIAPNGMKIKRFAVGQGQGAWQHQGPLLQYIGEFTQPQEFTLHFSRLETPPRPEAEDSTSEPDPRQLLVPAKPPEMAAARQSEAGVHNRPCAEKQIHPTLVGFFCGDEDEVVLENIEFERNSPALAPEARRVLDRVVLAMNEQPAMRVEIAGYTDSRGSETLNRRLSAKRAGTARLYLIYRDIAPERIVSTGYGEINPIADNDSPEGRRKNRRLTLKKLPADG